jgi:hypothetical protein
VGMAVRYIKSVLWKKVGGNIVLKLAKLDTFEYLLQRTILELPFNPDSTSAQQHSI